MGKPSILSVLEHYHLDGRYNYRRPWTPVRCPFHVDRHASASVNQEFEVFTCHACGIKGDAYAIVMVMEGCGFPEAKRLVQDWTGQADGDVSGEPVRSRSLLPSWTRNRRKSRRALQAR